MGIGLANPLQDIAWCVALFVLLLQTILNDGTIAQIAVQRWTR